MGFVFDQKPVDTTANAVPVLTNWTPAIGYMVWRSNSIAAYFYYQLVLEVRKDDASGTLFAKLKQRRNGHKIDVTNNYARTFFNLREIINTQIVDTDFNSNYSSNPKRKAIHLVGEDFDGGATVKIFSNSGDQILEKPQIIKIYVKGYENYSGAANTSPIDQTGDAINDTMWWYGASFPLEQVRYEGSAYIQSNHFKFWTASFGATDFFLSDLVATTGSVVSGSVLRNYVQSTDYHTVGFFNDYATFSSNVKYIEIVYYNSAGGVIGKKQYIENSATNGGLVPNGSHTDYTRILYFGCGPANLEASNVVATDEDGGSGAGQAQPSNFSGYAYYSLRGCIDTTPTGTDYITLPYYFILEDGSCKGFKVRRLAWVNSKGGWDYFNFKMKSTESIDINRDNYATVLGLYGGEKYGYSNTQRGKKTRRVTATRKEILNTDWISEDQAILLQNLFMSKNVNVVQNADTD